MNMNERFLKKYQPHRFDDFVYDKSYIKLLKSLIKMDSLNMLLIGNNGVGKTSLLNAIIREYYNTDKLPLNNVLVINNLKEQGIHYYRNQLKTFCQTASSVKNKKKIIILDDLDFIHKQSQQVFRNCIDKYSHKVNFIASCNNIQKIIENIQSRCNIIKVPVLNKTKLNLIIDNIISNEKIQINKKVKNTIIKISNGSIRLIINYLEKFKLLDYPINEKNVIDICTNISYSEFITYTKEWYINRNLQKSIKTIFNIYKKGYSVIDILDNYFNFVKYTDLIDQTDKFAITKIISTYISIFYTIHEKEIELALFTNNLIQNII